MWQDNAILNEIKLNRISLFRIIAEWHTIESFKKRFFMKLLMSWMLFAFYIQSTISPYELTTLASFPQSSFRLVISMCQRRRSQDWAVFQGSGKARGGNGPTVLLSSSCTWGSNAFLAIPCGVSSP